jgi:beta-ureidopropionase / N-carbamoyl-L-amino-acid hydrolase
VTDGGTRTDLRIDAKRLWDSLMEMADVGAIPEGGCRRLALTDEDKAALELFATWARGADCRISRDRVGNLFAERPGTDPSRPAVLVGSHLDTQPSGGRFDGAYGTLAALEIIRTLNDHRVSTVAPVVAVSWTNEEGARFPQPCTGSGVFSGALSFDEAVSQKAVDGPAFGDELRRLDFAGSDEVGTREFAVFFEAHIEQGPILESTGNAIGVVTGGQGLRGIAVRLIGAEAHAGTTPMEARRDALVGGDRIVTAVRELPTRRPGALATVSKLEVAPGSRSVVPGQVQLIVDVRHPDGEVLDELEADVRREVGEIAAGTELDVETETFLRVDPVTFDQSCVEAIRHAAERLRHPAMDLTSGAGHDAVYVARAIPTAMLFIPCRAGISHSPAEYAEPEHVQAGCDVLLQAVLEKAGVSNLPAGRAV